jgi:hypothetical protein
MSSMARLDPDKLHVTIYSGVSRTELVLPRRYTLTHSDLTGDLFLTVSPEYNLSQIKGLYTRFMRDEVLGEWQRVGKNRQLMIHCHVSGGFVFGWASMRYAIFRRELPLVLEAVVYAEQGLLEKDPELGEAQIRVRFHSSSARYDKIEAWGRLTDYCI